MSVTNIHNQKHDDVKQSQPYGKPAAFVPAEK